MTWQPDKNLENDTTLNEYQLKELGIMKQAIIKSAIEGGVITKRTPLNSDVKKNETDEEFVERWIRYCRRNEQKDRDLFFKQSNPF